MINPSIGVDVSKDHLDAFRWPDGASLKVKNDPAGLRALIRWTRPGAARVVSEPTGCYHRGLERALAAAAIPWSKANPLRARRFAEALGVKAKADRVDAATLARRGALLEPAPQAPVSRRPAGICASSTSPAPRS